MMKLVLVLLLATHAYGCGIKHSHSWPWQVSLQYFYGGGYNHICGGTLIDPYWVLTAASCVGFHTGTYGVILGEDDLNKKEGYEQRIAVDQNIIHPDWRPDCPACGNDIALIKLSKAAVLNNRVQTSCLPQRGEFLPASMHCYITGWGGRHYGSPIASKLQQVTLLVDPNTCGSSSRTDMICARGDISSVCYGCYGCPLNCRGYDGRWYVQGVAGFMPYSSCNMAMPTLFTRTSSFTQWIRVVTGIKEL